MPVPSVLTSRRAAPLTHGSMPSRGVSTGTGVDMRRQTQQADVAGPSRPGLRAAPGWAWKVGALLGLVVWAGGVAPAVVWSERVRGPGYGMPKADTGNRLLN